MILKGGDSDVGPKYRKCSFPLERSLQNRRSSRFDGSSATFSLDYHITIWPLPSTVTDYFALFQNKKLIGLLDFSLIEFVAYVLFIPMFLAIYVAIKKANESYMTLALTLAMTGIVVYLATNNPFSMLSLSYITVREMSRGWNDTVIITSIILFLF